MWLVFSLVIQAIYVNMMFLDFELGMTNGLLRVFPNTTISRCLFHLYQAVFRKIKVRFLL